MELLALNVKKLRELTGITQEQLADRIGVGQTTVNNIETGYLTAPPLKIVEALAEAFDTAVDGILGRAPLEVGERARLIYVVSSMDAENSLVEKDRIVDGIFVDRDKLRGFEFFGLKIPDDALAGEGICRGYTAVVKRSTTARNNDIVAASVADSDEVIVRIYYKKGDTVILKAKNDSGLYKDIAIDTLTEKFKLIGTVEFFQFKRRK